MTRTILVADDDADVVDLLSRRCRSLGYQVETADNAIAALEKVKENRPDLVMLDVDMPRGNGLGVCEMMASHEQLRTIPVIMLTACSGESVVRRCHQLCAYYVLKCPDAWTRIEPLLQDIFTMDRCEREESMQPADQDFAVPNKAGAAGLVDTLFAVLGVEDGDLFDEEPSHNGRERSSQPWVLSIEDDDDVALALRLRLAEDGVKVVRAQAGREGYRKAFLDTPRAILLDYELPQDNGDYVLRRLKESPVTRDIPVIVLTGRRETSIERQMRNLGASEFFTKPFDWKRLRAAINGQLIAASL